MNNIDKWLDNTYKELEQMIAEQEDEFVDLFIGEYLTTFYVDDQQLKDTVGNYIKANEINKRFDDAYDVFIIPFLIWYGNKLLESGKLAVDYFNSIGINATMKDISYLSKRIGIDGKNIIKGSFLWNLGQFGEIRQRMQEAVINAVASTQKLNVAIRNIKPLFKSTKADRSLLAKYYLKYAYTPIMQTLNGVSYKLAKQYGLTRFRYSGGLMEKSRDFCIERDGNIYTIEDGKKWNELEWRGKIQGVDFFIQIGGFFCRHFLEWLKDEDNE